MLASARQPPECTYGGRLGLGSTRGSSRRRQQASSRGRQACTCVSSLSRWGWGGGARAGVERAGLRGVTAGPCGPQGELERPLRAVRADDAALETQRPNLVTVREGRAAGGRGQVRAGAWPESPPAPPALPRHSPLVCKDAVVVEKGRCIAASLAEQAIGHRERRPCTHRNLHRSTLWNSNQHCMGAARGNDAAARGEEPRRGLTGRLPSRARSARAANKSQKATRQYVRRHDLRLGLPKD